MSFCLVGLAFGLSPAASFDGTPTPQSAPVATPAPQAPAAGRALAPLPAVPNAATAARPSAAANAARMAPFDALRTGTQALRDGRPEQAVTALEYAANQGVPGAMWKLGRMYADGEGVNQNKLRAFEYFRDLTKAHAYDPPGTPQARFVANAFVSLGNFYLDGIPDTSVRADPTLAHEMFRYAASYFADPDAQFSLGRLYLLGKGTTKDSIQAARWLRLAANKGQHSAQALLGTMLFKGEDLTRQAAMGLFWLTVAKDGIAKEGASPEDAWITETYSTAFAQANDEERALAYKYLEEWVRTRRE
jgi:exopolysaccharide production negative regulator